MKVALVNPGNDLRRMLGMYAAAMQPQVPQGLCYVAACLERAGHEVRLDDQYATHEPTERLARRIVDWGADVVGLSVLTSAARWAEALSRELRRLKPDVFLVMGNIHARVFAEDLLAAGLTDAIVHQEGEETMVDLVAHLADRRPLDDVLGVSWWSGAAAVHNPPRPLIEDLDALPYPAYHLLDLSHYVAPPMLSLMEPILAVQASRGCPFTCTYCTQENLPKGIRTRTMASVVDEMAFYLERYGVRFQGFLDANFPFRKRQALEMAELMRKRGLADKIQWLTETRVDLVDEEVIRELRSVGLRLIMFGFESGSQEMLDSYRKRASLESARQAMVWCKKYGVAVLGLFMIGMPGETPESARATFRFARELDPDFAKFNIAVPYPGSEFFEQWRRDQDGPMDWEKFSSWLDLAAAGELLYTPEGISSRELVSLRDEGMRQFYLRPRFIARHLLQGTLQLPGVWRGIQVFVGGRLRSEAERRLSPLTESLAGGKAPWGDPFPWRPARAPEATGASRPVER